MSNSPKKAKCLVAIKRVDKLNRIRQLDTNRANDIIGCKRDYKIDNDGVIFKV